MEAKQSINESRIIPYFTKGVDNLEKPHRLANPPPLPLATGRKITTTSKKIERVKKLGTEHEKVAKILNTSTEDIENLLKNTDITNHLRLKAEITAAYTKWQIEKREIDNCNPEAYIYRSRLDGLCMLAAKVLETEEELKWVFYRAPDDATECNARFVIAKTLMDKYTKASE